jgi:hypothetical protein
MTTTRMMGTRFEHSIRSSEPDGPTFSDTEGDQEGLSDSECDGNVDGDSNNDWFSSSEASETVGLVRIDAQVPDDLTKRRQAGPPMEESPFPVVARSIFAMDPGKRMC